MQLELRILAIQRYIRLQPTILKLIAVRIILRKGLGNGFTQCFRIPARQSLYRISGINILPCRVRTLYPTLRGKGTDHIDQVILECSNFPSFGHFGRSGTRQTVRDSTAVVDESVSLRTRSILKLNPTVTCFVFIAWNRIRYGSVGANRTKYLFIARYCIFTQRIHVGISIGIILWQLSHYVAVRIFQ